ncbi:MAG: amidohydrolase family protein [Steroidobacter sp.]
MARKRATYLSSGRTTARTAVTRYTRLLAGCIALLSGALAHAETVAIVHAKAWTLSADTPLDDATIVMTDGRIVSVAAGGPRPPGARIVDASGRPVTPGLMNSATQLGLTEVGAAAETVDHTAKGANAPGAAFDVQYAINPDSALIRLARADGLTRAVSLPLGSAAPPFSGRGALLRLVEGDELLERAHAGVFAIIGNRSAMASVGSRAAQWQLLRTALDTAKANLASPASVTTRPPDTLALEPVLAGKTPLAIATNRASDLRQAVKLARDYALRIVIIGGAEAWLAAPELAAANIAVILNPMLNLPWSFDELGARLDNAALLNKAGVTIAMSLGGVQSYNAGSSLREGAGLAVANGLPYIEGLRSIITGPARIWGVSDRYGTIEPGKDGDLVIWDGDPLEPASLPATVFVQGKEASLVTHQSELRDRYLPAIEKTRGAATSARP